MHTVPIAAYTCAENRLWKVVTDIQTEFAPHFFFDIFCGAVMQPGICKKILDRLYTFALIRCCQFTENNSDRRFRVETISVFLFISCGYRPAWVELTARERSFVEKCNKPQK